MMKRYLPVISVVLAAVFFGVALYISVAEQPARLSLADAPMLAEWQVSFQIGFVLQGTLTILAGLCGLATWWFVRDWRFLAGGVFMLANWPWTLLVIAPINTALTGMDPASASDASRVLVEEWGQVHLARTLFAMFAALLFAWGLTRRVQE